MCMCVIMHKLNKVFLLALDYYFLLCRNKKVELVIKKMFLIYPLGPSLEEKLFSSCDLTADSMAQVNFKSKQSLAEMGPRAKVSTQFQSSTRARNWAVAPEDLSSVFAAENVPEGPVAVPSISSSAAESSPQTSSNSGERSACFLDFIAAASLPCFAEALTHDQGIHFIFCPGEIVLLFLTLAKWFCTFFSIWICSLSLGHNGFIPDSGLGIILLWPK